VAPESARSAPSITRQLAEYVDEMGISEDLLTLMSQVPHEAIRELTPDDARQLQLVDGLLLQPRAAAQ
jgi:hypothetical protein